MGASLNRQEKRRASERREARQRRDPFGFHLFIYFRLAWAAAAVPAACSSAARRPPSLREVSSHTWGSPCAAKTFEGYFASNLDTRLGDIGMGGGETPRHTDSAAAVSLRGKGGLSPRLPLSLSGRYWDSTTTTQFKLDRIPTTTLSPQDLAVCLLTNWALVFYFCWGRGSPYSPPPFFFLSSSRRPGKGQGRPSHFSQEISPDTR